MAKEVKFNQNQISQYMRARRPLTRSLAAEVKQSIGKPSQQPNLSPQKQLVDSWLTIQDFDEALKVLSEVTPTRHWVHCKKAQIYYQMGQPETAVQSAIKSLTYQRESCTECIQLVLRALDSPLKRTEGLDQVLSNIFDSEEMPEEYKAQMRSKRHKIITKYPTNGVEMEPRFQNLLEHYQNAGAFFKKMEIRQIERDYRIVVAKKTIEPNELIISVPENEIITLDKIKRKPQIDILQANEKSLKSPKHCMLSVFLLQELARGEDSHFSSYIRCLPKEVKNFPLYYGEELLAELKGTTFLEALLNKKEDIEEDYETIKKLLDDEQFDYEKFKWARMVVSSRIFGVSVHGVKTDALVPLADMLNHKDPKMTTWTFSDEKNSFVVQNLDGTIQEGEEICDSYGCKCNSRFLLNYGFVQPNNTFNEVGIQFIAYEDSPYAPPCLRISLQLMSEELRMVLTYYRRAAAISMKWKPTNREFRQRMRVQFISDQIEAEVWKYIKVSVKKRMKRFHTSIKHDEKLLRSTELTYNMRNCVQVRKGEKRVLEFFLVMADTMIDHFSGRKRVEPHDKTYESYFIDINGYGQ